MEFKDLIGHELDKRVIEFDDRDAILYAIAVGATAAELDLVYERGLRVLPTLGCALGLWAVEAAGELGVYDRTRSLHAAQSLQVHQPLTTGALEMQGRVAAVWDKGKATIVEVEVLAEAFTAVYTIFLPSIGGWGGERGPSSRRGGDFSPSWTTEVSTWADQAILYRLTGDRHPLHVDAELAQSMGFKRPILHGLCTLGMTAKTLAQAVDAHPADLTSLSCRLAAPVLPGDTLTIAAAAAGESGELAFQTSVGETAVLSAGQATFS